MVRSALPAVHWPPPKWIRRHLAAIRKAYHAAGFNRPALQPHNFLGFCWRVIGVEACIDLAHAGWHPLPRRAMRYILTPPRQRRMISSIRVRRLLRDLADLALSRPAELRRIIAAAAERGQE